ncbi:MFS transporter [Oceanicaulis sp. MMSF_3324]|uniref:MFS transporter n=1 Tax=Oceanicaulis sp. MMSF_3324 TaxID=3046702 RepID=UPI00273F440E|nr:MFS transporter [Oceanicaulis sp. MMSF_3324]
MVTSFLTSPDLARTRSLIAAIVCAALAGCGFGLLMPLVALNLEAMTGSAAIVGTNAAAAALSTLLATPLIPALMARMPPRQTVVISALVTALGFVLFPAMPDPVVWFILRFAMGLSVTVIFVASETWINQLAKPESRASLLAVYATVLSGGFGSGGLLLALLGSEGWTPWLAGGAIYALGALPILILKGPQIEPPSVEDSGLKSLLGAAQLAPMAILAGLVFGGLETNVFSLMPVYAERIGIAEQGVGLLVAIGALGAIMLQIPLGKLADRTGRDRTLSGVALSAVILSIAMGLAGANLWLLIPMVFFFVGASSAFYTIGLAMIGERVRPGALASANAAFIFAYGLGSLLGPALGGVSMDLADPWGLMAAFAAMAGLYFVLSILSKPRSRH